MSADLARCVDAEGNAQPSHDWSAWMTKPEHLPAAKYEQLRFCHDCGRYEGIGPAGVKVVYAE